MDTLPETTLLEPSPAIAIREEVALADLPAFFGRAFAELGARAGADVAGPPFARYHQFGPKIDVEAVMPVRARIAGDAHVHAIDLPGGPAVQVRHVGPYEELAETYNAIEHWIEDHHRERADAVREVYLNEPAGTDRSQLVTLVIQPVRASQA